MLDEAAALAGVGPFTAVQKQMMLDGLTSQRDSYAPIRALKMANSVPPAYVFHPLPAAKEIKYTPAKKCTDSSIEHGEIIYSSVLSSTPKAPAYIEDLAFSSISEIANLMRDRVITSLDLTKMYLERLKRYDSKLHFIITLTEERALAQARAF
jgi:hypothetical protein